MLIRYRQAILAALFFGSALCTVARGQAIVDKTVAVVSEGTKYELITYSDLLWQLALQPGAALDKPRSADLNQALKAQIDQRLFALESQRLPTEAPSQKEISDEIARILSFFPSTAVFEARLKQVGFQSIKDDAFERLIAQRLATEKYTDFRFRSFVVVTAEDEDRYYRERFVPEFRKKYPGSLLPSLDEKRSEIREILTQMKIADRIEAFLDEARRRATIDILIEV